MQKSPQGRGESNAKFSAREGKNKVWMPQKSYGFAGFVSESHNDEKFRLPRICRIAYQNINCKAQMHKMRIFTRLLQLLQAPTSAKRFQVQVVAPNTQGKMSLSAQYTRSYYPKCSHI